jgi:ParB family chromosome partitioning protein
MSTATLEAPVDGLRLVELPVSALAAHPGNVRRDLKITKEYVENIKRFGVKTPLTVVPEGDGYRISDGHRRLAGAIAAGRETVPCLVDDRLAGDEAQQLLDMVTTARHREGLTPLEEAGALFQAHQQGATKTALAVAIGSRMQAANALKAAGLTAEQQTAAEEADYEFSLTQLAALSEFAGEQDVFNRLLSAAEEDDFDRQYEMAVIDRRDEAERAKLTAEIEAAGVAVLHEVPREARRIGTLTDARGNVLTEESHRSCAGHRALVTAATPPEVTYYCADPVDAGHTAALPARTTSEQDTALRAHVTLGNKEWRAAEALRQKFLTSLIARSAVSAALAEIINRFATMVWIKFPEPLHNAQQGKVRDMTAGLLGIERADGEAMGKLAHLCGKARLPLIALAAVAAPYEVYACQIKSWRTDTDPYDRRWRPYAAEWLGVLASFGYTLTPIEQAVVDDVEYTPAENRAPSRESEAPHEQPQDAAETETEAAAA